MRTKKDDIYFHDIRTEKWIPSFLLKNIYNNCRLVKLRNQNTYKVDIGKSLKYTILLTLFSIIS